MGDAAGRNTRGLEGFLGRCVGKLGGIEVVQSHPLTRAQAGTVTGNNRRKRVRHCR